MTAPPAEALHVTLLRHGDLILIDLADTQTLVPRSEVRVDDALLGDLRRAVGAASTRHGTEPERELARVGGLLFSRLLTPRAQERLRVGSHGDLYLRVDEHLVNVPWELCHDGERFLCERFRIGRQVITTRRIPEASARRASRDLLRVLVIADPGENLPQAAIEAERLCVMLDDIPEITVTLFAGRSARRVPLLSALQEHDVVHFAGHSHFDAAMPANSGWHLADGLLTARELARLQPSPILAFANARGAAADEEPEPATPYDSHAHDVGSAFLIAGIENYLGTLWVTHDAETSALASAFYRHLAAGGSLGEALAEARRIAVEPQGRRSLSAMGLMLYGDPAVRPLPLTTTPEPSRIAPRPEPAARAGVRYSVSVAPDGADAPRIDRLHEPSQLVGREAELARLEANLAAVLDHECRAVFLVGPPGIGKTTLLDAFVARVVADGSARVARGQAIEQYGAGEAYLPVLDALGRLATAADGTSVVDHLRRHAPTWLAQLATLVGPEEQEALARSTLGSTRERMLRELGDLLEAVTEERPLVVVIEDLHWSDPATIDAIAYLTQRRSPARLLLVGTYRATEVIASEHPLRAVVQELEARRRAEEIPVGVLSEGEVERYLAVRAGVAQVDPRLREIVHRRTEGHPLFLVNVVDFALSNGLAAARDGRFEVCTGGETLLDSIPRGLLPMIERQIEALPAPAQELLEAAAVAGAEFSSAAVGAALDDAPDEIEDRCEGLAWRGQFIRAAGVEEWPDGTLGGRYRFVHALYQNVLYQRVAEARRARLHRRIAERKAGAFGTRAAEIAAELAVHFEASRDLRRALEQRIAAADRAVRRHAEREAVEHYRHALRLLAQIGSPSEAGHELEVLVKLATRLMSTAGYAAAELERIFDRAYALSRQLPATASRAPLLRTMVSFHQVRAQCETARRVGDELLTLCASSDDPIAFVQAHYGHGATLYDLGELAAAQRHLETALAHYEPQDHRLHVGVYGGYDPGVACRFWLGWLLWMRGQVGDSNAAIDAGMALAEQLAHPFSLGFACMSTAVFHLHRGDPAAAGPPLARARRIALEDGFPFLQATVVSVEGWIALTSGDPERAIACCEEALAAQELTGARLSRPAYWTVMAYAYAFTGRFGEATATIDRALEEVERTQQRLYAPGVWRARGDFFSFQGGDAASRAESCFRRALEIAGALDAPVVELQAALGLARHLRIQDREPEIRPILTPILARIREDGNAPLLREARGLLDRS